MMDKKESTSSDQEKGTPTILRYLPGPLRKLTTSRWWFLPPVGAGILILVLAKTLSPGTARESSEEIALPVRVMTIQATDVVPSYAGYGRVQAANRWQAMAQVPGAISWRHENLNEGASFPANSHLLTIDQHDYLVAVARAESQVLSAEANRIELVSREKDLHRSIEIETESVQIAGEDYERNLSLSNEGHISPTQLSNQKQALLRQEQSIQTLQSQLHLIPAQRSVREARYAEAIAVLSKANEDLRRTEVKLPFAARIDKLNVELGQFVPAGQSMLIAESNLAVEVLMELPFDIVISRFPGLMAEHNQAVGANSLKAVVTHPSGLHWNGIVRRVDSGLSDVNRSVRIYIEIILEDNQSPPPSNLYLEVELIGETLVDRLVIPRSARRQGQVLVASQDDRLEIRATTVELKVHDVVILRSGLKAGERVVLSDLLMPVNGRLLKPIEELKAASL